MGNYMLRGLRYTTLKPGLQQCILYAAVRHYTDCPQCGSVCSTKHSFYSKCQSSVHQLYKTLNGRKQRNFLHCSDHSITNNPSLWSRYQEGFRKEEEPHCVVVLYQRHKSMPLVADLYIFSTFLCLVLMRRIPSC